MKRFFVFSTMLMLVFALTMFSGCATRGAAEPEPEVQIVYRDREVVRIVEVQPPPPPPREVTLFPLTPALAERLENDLDRLYHNKDRLQLVVSGGATLERSEFFQHPFELSGMNTKIINERIRHLVTLDDSTKGEAIAVDFVRGDIVLSVSFEQSRNLFLEFVNVDGDDAHYGLFYLVYTPTPAGPGRGYVMYGHERFTVNYTGDRPPHLLLVLTEYDIDRLFARTIPGRTVPTASHTEL